MSQQISDRLHIVTKSDAHSPLNCWNQAGTNFLQGLSDKVAGMQLLPESALLGSKLLLEFDYCQYIGLNYSKLKHFRHKGKVYWSPCTNSLDESPGCGQKFLQFQT